MITIAPTRGSSGQSRPYHFNDSSNNLSTPSVTQNTPFRRTSQRLAPASHSPTTPGNYDIYPGFPIGSDAIGAGFDTLARRIAGAGTVVIDGYGGILWETFRDRLDAALRVLGVEAQW